MLLFWQWTRKPGWHASHVDHHECFNFFGKSRCIKSSKAGLEYIVTSLIRERNRKKANFKTFSRGGGCGGDGGVSSAIKQASYGLPPWNVQLRWSGSKTSLWQLPWSLPGAPGHGNEGLWMRYWWRNLKVMKAFKWDILGGVQREIHLEADVPSGHDQAGPLPRGGERESIVAPTRLFFHVLLARILIDEIEVLHFIFNGKVLHRIVVRWLWAWCPARQGLPRWEW